MSQYVAPHENPSLLSYYIQLLSSTLKYFLSYSNFFLNLNFYFLYIYSNYLMFSLVSIILWVVHANFSKLKGFFTSPASKTTLGGLGAFVSLGSWNL